MKGPKKFLMNPWTITLGSGLIILLVTVVIDLVTAEKVFSTLATIIFSVWCGILALLNFELKVWWVLAGIAVLIFARFLCSKYLDSKQTTHKDPEFISYTKDYILGYHWKWIWKKDLYDKLYIENLHPVCNECETPLTLSYGYGELKCLRCGKVYHNAQPDENDVKMLIHDNVRRKYYPNE